MIVRRLPETRDERRLDSTYHRPPLGLI